MALTTRKSSSQTTAGGSYRFEGKMSYIGSDGSRKRRSIAITIGPVNEIKKRDAEFIADHIGKLIKSQALGLAHSAQQLAFIAGLSDDLYDRVASCDLVPERVRDLEIETDLTIEELFDDWKEANSHMAYS